MPELPRSFHQRQKSTAGGPRVGRRKGTAWGHWEARGTPEGRQGYWLASEGEEERRRGEEARWEEE